MNITDKGLLGAVILIGIYSSGLFAATPTSTNYRLPWAVLDGGGAVSTSTNYQLAGSVQANVGTTASSTNYVLVSGFHSPPDTDSDTVRDFLDNCSAHANTAQRDTDGDGYGNRCDPDFNNDNVVNGNDLAYFKTKFFSSDPDADLNGDGSVNGGDLAIFKLFFFKPPGPSGLN